jgi:hypothetical protein
MVKEMTVQRFDVPYSEAAVEDLRQRLVRTRWPDQIPGSHWDYGVSLDYMKEICQYWKDEFDWKRQIEKMSAFHHYRYTSRGVGIHFIHERGKGPAPIPLILTHGWPGKADDTGEETGKCTQWDRRGRGSGSRRKVRRDNVGNIPSAAATDDKLQRLPERKPNGRRKGESRRGWRMSP